MKLPKYITILLILYINTTYAQTKLLNTIKCKYECEINGIITDTESNVYVTGCANETDITFDKIILKGKGSYDVFVAKYDSLGNLLWAKSYGGLRDEKSHSISINKKNELYITGYFNSPTITFGNIKLTKRAGEDDVFVAKMDTSGNVLWAKSFGSTGREVGTSIATDDFDNLYVTGYFTSEKMIFGSTTLINKGIGDLFTLKLDASGNVLWAISIGGDEFDFGVKLVVDHDENIYIIANFNSPSLKVGDSTFTRQNLGPYFLLIKFNAQGKILWATVDETASKKVDPEAIIVNKTGEIYITGYFNCGTLKFGKNTLNNIANYDGSADVFIVKYDSDGRVLWEKNFGGNKSDEANDITIDSEGNIYIVGDYSQKIDFDSYSLTNANTNSDSNGWSPDIFIAKLDPLGNVLWVKSYGGIDLDNGEGIFVDKKQNLYVTGKLSSKNASFDNVKFNGIDNSNNLFIVKMRTNQ